MTKPMIRLVTFDAMETLFKVKYNVGSIYLSSAKKLLPEDTIHLTEDEVHKGYKAFRENYKHYPNHTHDQTSSEKFWLNVIKSTFHSVGVSLNDGKARELTKKLYTDFTLKDYWLVYPEVHTVLKKLKSRNVNMAVVSNFDERLEMLLENLELNCYFQYVISSKTVGFSKPEPEIFKCAITKTNTSIHESLHIGDKLEDDYNAARNFGMYAVLISRDTPGVSVPEDVLKVSSLDEIFNHFTFDGNL